MKVYGPYVHKTGQLKGRKYVTIHCDGKKTSMLYSRYIMEQKIGRKLEYDETVDHIDEDFTNDDISNLKIETRSDNAKKSARLRRKISYIEFICPECKQPSKKEERYVKHNRSMGKAGPFCSRSCAGKYRPA